MNLLALVSVKWCGDCKAQVFFSQCKTFVVCAQLAKTVKFEKALYLWFVIVRSLSKASYSSYTFLVIPLIVLINSIKPFVPCGENK